VVDGGGDLLRQLREDALAGALAQRHGLDGGCIMFSAQAKAKVRAIWRVMRPMAAAAARTPRGR
jgi:hypothetical protein